MSWLRKILGLRRPVEIRLQVLDIKGEPVREFTLDHWENISRMFLLVPGLYDILAGQFDEELAKLAILPATLEAERERIRLSQAVGDLKTFLDLPRRAVAEINRIRAQQAQDLAQGEKRPKGVSNLIEGANS